MEFYIELTDIISTFRLQKDLSWRKIDKRDLVETDFLTRQVYEAIKIQVIDGQIRLDNKIWNLNPTSTSFGEKEIETLHYDIFVKRAIKPPTPSREQLVTVIAQGDDRISNSLILNVYGLFELRDFHTLNISIEDPTIVLRNESFSAGTDYVGKDASKDTTLINGLYKDCLAHWLIHLQSGRTNMYSDTQTAKTLDDLFLAIENLDLEK